jgi:hypothetical protein
MAPSVQVAPFWVVSPGFVQTWALHVLAVHTLLSLQSAPLLHVHVQLTLQPSASFVLPSSHCSPGSALALPHTASVHFPEEQ